MKKLSSKYTNKHILLEEKLSSKKKKSNNENNKHSEDKNIKKKLFFSFSDKKLENNKNFSSKNVKNFTPKNKNILKEFLKRALIKKSDKDLLLMENLKKDPSIRTKDDILIIKDFLMKSSLVNAILKIPFFVKKNCENFISSISNELKIKNFKDEEILFKIGEKVDNFYILYSGNIIIEKLESFTIPLTRRQYIKSIFEQYQKIYKYKDKYAIKDSNLFVFKKIIYNEELEEYSKYILEKCIEENKNYVKIEENEIPLLNLIILIIDIKNLFDDIRGSYDLLLLLIKDNNYDYKKILKGLEYLSNTFYAHNSEFNMKQIYKNIPEINPEIIEKYENIIEDKTRYNFVYFKKGKIIRLQTAGDCFGDISPELKFDNLKISKNLKRNYSANSLENSTLAYIPFERFTELLRIEKEEIKNEESKFLKSSFFFNSINLFVFINKYLNYFIYEELPYNNYLFKQEQKNKYVYFLKHGRYEVFCKKSIKDICQTVNQIADNYLKGEKKSDYIKITNNLIKNMRWCSFIRKEFLIDIPINILVLTKSFVLGLESLYNNLPYLYNVKVLSEKCGFYKIEYKHLKQLMKEIKNGNEILFHENMYHLKLFLDRLVQICDRKVQFINNERKASIFDNEENSKINLNNGKIKTKVYINKINNYLRENSKNSIINQKTKTNDNLICLTTREEEDKYIKDKNRVNLYLTEINSTTDNKNYKNKKRKKIFGRSINKFNNIKNNNTLKDNKNFNLNEERMQILYLNKDYNTKNIIDIKKDRLLDNNNIALYKTKYNPVQIKYEKNLTKKLKETLENELLFCYFKKDKLNTKIKTSKTEPKSDKKIKNKESLSRISIFIKENENKNNKSDLSNNNILPYYNSSKNIHKNLENFRLPVDFIIKKKRNTTRNKPVNLYPLEILDKNINLTKNTISSNTNYLDEKLIFNDYYNKTFNNFNKRDIISKYNNDEEISYNHYINKNKTIYENKNKFKGYNKFNGIKNIYKQNIETYSFKGKKYIPNYKNYYNKRIYKSIKERLEDSLFMNGQLSSPKINKEYY